MNWNGNKTPINKQAPRKNQGEQAPRHLSKGERLVNGQQTKERQEEQMMAFSAIIRKKEDRATEQLTNYQILRKLKKMRQK